MHPAIAPAGRSAIAPPLSRLNAKSAITITPTIPKLRAAHCSWIAFSRHREHWRKDTCLRSRTHERQIILVRYVGLRANPRDLCPEQSGEVSPLRRVQGEAIVHKNAYVSLLLRHFKDILCKMTCTKVNWLFEDVPFIPTGGWYFIGALNLGAVRNFSPTLPTGRTLFLSKLKRTAIDRGDSDVFPENNLRAEVAGGEIVGPR
jgi:hypothetical protein